MKVPIMKAVANPPKILWAPMVPAILNFGLQLPFMFISISLFGANPLMFMGTILIGHAILAVYGAREQHLSNMIESFGRSSRGGDSRYPAGGRKYAP